MTQEVLKLALEALDNLLYWDNGKPEYDEAREAITAIKEALREHAMREVQRLGQEIEQEPVAWKLMPRDATDAMLKAMDECSTEGYDERLYAGHAASVYMAAWDEAPTPPQRTWVGLTDDEIIDVLHPLVMADMSDEATDYEIARAIEAKLKKKNT